MPKPHFFGFESIQDFITSLLGVKYGTIHTCAVFIFSLITSFITGFVFEEPSVVFTLWSLMAFDWITGISKSIKNGSFVSYKLWRMPIYFIVTTALLSASFWMSKSSFVFTLLPNIVVIGFMSVYFISILENLGELEFIPQSFVSVLRNKFGFKTLIDKHFKEEEKDDKDTDDKKEI